MTHHAAPSLTYSAEGVELRLYDRHVESRNWGRRPDGTESETLRVLKPLLAGGGMRGVIADLRHAVYSRNAADYGVRVRAIARVLNGMPLAEIIRPGQEDKVEAMRKACAVHGGQVRAFTSLTAARDWLNALLDGEDRLALAVIPVPSPVPAEA